MRTWLVLSGLGVGACLVLGGCDGEPAPVVTESPSVTASPVFSSSPSPTPSVLTSAELLALLPPNAGEADVQGAVVTAEFFLEQYAPMFHSGNTVVWDALSGADCTYCSDASSNAREVAELGWTATGGEITPDTSTSRGLLKDDGTAQVKFLAHFDDAFLVKDSATPELQEAAGDHMAYLELVLVDGVWRVNGVTVDG